MTRAAGECRSCRERSGFWLLPDYDDFNYAGRSAEIIFTPFATAPVATDQLRALATEIAENGLASGNAVATPIGDEIEFRRNSFTARLGPRLTSELAELLLRLAVNQLRQAGLPTREERLVMTDPFEME